MNRRALFPRTIMPARLTNAGTFAEPECTAAQTPEDRSPW